MATYEPKKILVPVDLSSFSLGVVRAAVDMGRKWGAEILVLYVGQAPNHPSVPQRLPLGEAGCPSSVYFPSPSQFAEGSRLRMESQLRLMTREFAGEPKLRVAVVWGDPMERILQAASEGGHDLIVMATHGREGWDRFLLGSVAEHVIRHAPCPVLAIREKLAEAQFATAS